MHGWQHRQIVRRSVVYFTTLSLFQLELQDGRQMIWKEAVVPNQGIPLFTLNARTKL